VASDLRQPFCTLCPGKYILPLLVGDPGAVSVEFQSATTLTMTILGLIFSVITIGGALFKRRFWCPYCPMGLLMSWYKKIAFIKLKKESQKCTMCEVCHNVCPVDIEQVFKEREREDVTFSDCILCFKCIEYCPEDDALRATFLGKTIYRSTRKGFFTRLRAVPAALVKNKKKSLERING
jgi:polyferredoxin